MGRVICLIGIDGAGKSSQAEHLVRALREKGIRCKGTHLRVSVFRLVSLPVLLLCRLLKVPEEANHPRCRGSRLLTAIWPYLFFLDFVLFYLIFNFPYYIFPGTVFVFDRYYYDGLVELMVSTGDRSILEGRVGRLFQAVFPRPEVAIYMDVDEGAALRRTPENHTIEYLRKRRVFYKELADRLGMTTIDANRSFEEVQRDIYKLVEAKGLA